MSKPKVMVIEYFSHYKVLENTYHLLHNFCELTFYFSIHKNEQALSQFPSRKLVNFKACNKAAYISFWPLVWKCKNYDWVYISTGPQSSHITTWLTLTQFLLIRLFYGKKIILTMRSARDYLPVKNKTDIFTYIRSLIIKGLKRFTFETPASARNFIKDSNLQNIKCAVSYDRFTDFFPPRLHTLPKVSKKVRVGLLGVISHSTKDYQVVLDALAILDEHQKQNIEFVNIAYCPNALQNDIIEAISSHCKVDITPGFLDTDQFDQLGSSCHLLLSPLKKELEYGSYKGSGSFGDMVYLRRRTLLPTYCDPHGDYSEICNYYNCANDLAELFKNSRSLALTGLSEEFLRSFSTQIVRDEVFKQLNLCD